MLRLVRALPLTLLLAGPAAGLAQTAPVQLDDVRVEQGDGGLSVRLHTTAAPKYSVSMFNSPSRIVIDLSDTRFAWGMAGTATLAAPEAAPIRRVRGSQFTPGMTRVVVELTRKVGYRVEEIPDGLVVWLDAAATAAPARAREPVSRPEPAASAPRPAASPEPTPPPTPEPASGPEPLLAAAQPPTGEAGATPDPAAPAGPLAPAPVPAAPDLLPGAGRLLAGLVVLVGLLYLASRYIRRLPIARLLPGADGPITVVARAHLGARERLCLVQVGPTTVLIAVTAQGVTPLHAWPQGLAGAGPPAGPEGPQLARDPAGVPGQLRDLQARLAPTRR